MWNLQRRLRKRERLTDMIYKQSPTNPRSQSLESPLSLWTLRAKSEFCSTSSFPVRVRLFPPTRRRVEERERPKKSLFKSAMSAASLGHSAHGLCREDINERQEGNPELKVPTPRGIKVTGKTNEELGQSQQRSDTREHRTGRLPSVQESSLA